jgi:c-di-GMP-binding flagellar brake protein YcgR
VSIQVGTALEIQIGGKESRLTSELIGIEEDKYLIIKMPTVQSMAGLSSALHKGNRIIIRYMHMGTIFGFKSHIIHFITSPTKLIFIQYPERIETHELRANKRLNCYLPANVKIMDNTIEGTVTDISKGGCYLVIEKAKVASSLILQVGDEIGISFQLPGVENKLTVAGKQKNIKKDEDSVGIGIQFDNMNIEMQKRIYDFLSTADA